MRTLRPSARRRNRLSNQRGWTIIELLLTFTIMGLVTLAIVTLFSKAMTNMGHDEASTGLKKTNEEAMGYLFLKLGANKRLYQNDSDGVSLLARLDRAAGGAYVGGTYPASPATLVNSTLPTIQSAGSFDQSTTLFSAASFGNILLFLAQDQRVTCRAVTNVLGQGMTIALDTYKLYCFYLTTDNPRAIPNRTTYRLMEWRSAPLVDGPQLEDVYNSDPILGAHLTAQLNSPTPQPTPQQPITYAVDYSQPTSLAYFTLASAGAASISAASFTIPRDYPVSLCSKAVTWLGKYSGDNPWTYLKPIGMARLIKHGVPANDPAYKVPSFAPVTAGSSFPGGFEVGIIGNGGGRLVLVRLTHIADFMNFVTQNTQTDVVSCRDIY